MAKAAECIATAVGAPFLRSDFFIGSERWGIRLNEVAYGSGVDYCRRSTESSTPIDDGPAIAQILQEGFKVCQSLPAEDFLSSLGAQGSYHAVPCPGEVDQRRPGMEVTAVSPPRRARLPTGVLQRCEESVGATVPEASLDECRTVKASSARRRSHASFGVPVARQTPVGYPTILSPRRVSVPSMPIVVSMPKPAFTVRAPTPIKKFY